MGGVCTVGVWWEETVSVYIDFEEENSGIEWIVFKFWGEDKGVEKVATCECLWRAECGDGAV